MLDIPKELQVTNYADAANLQKRLALQVSTKDSIKKIRNVCAVDVSYKDKLANASAVIMGVKNLDLIECVTSTTMIKTPYIPGLMMLREAGPIISALNL